MKIGNSEGPFYLRMPLICKGGGGDPNFHRLSGPLNDVERDFRAKSFNAAASLHAFVYELTLETAIEKARHEAVAEGASAAARLTACRERAPIRPRDYFFARWMRGYSNRFFQNERRSHRKMSTRAELPIRHSTRCGAGRYQKCGRKLLFLWGLFAARAPQRRAPRP